MINLKVDMPKIPFMVVPRNMGRVWTRIGMQTTSLSQKYSPISPSKRQIDKANKVKEKKDTSNPLYQSGKSGSRSAVQPGSLTKSIRSISDDRSATVLVPVNSAAGEYAYKIHELKNKPGGWKKCGPGTILKGSEADEKFIERAAEKVISGSDAEKIITDEIEKAWNKK